MLKSIKDIKHKILNNDVEGKFHQLIDKVANYSIDPEDLLKVKKVDERINLMDIQFARVLNKIKK